MKILILSDSHGNISAVKKAVALEQPDRVFHLGDLCMDASRLAAAYPKLPINGVAGNCDIYSAEKGPEEQIVTFEGLRFLLAHGHRYRVKMGTALLFQQGLNMSVDMICFGHTHKALCKRQNGVWLVNPGSVGGVGVPPSYAVAEAADGCVSVELRHL